jgi:hypothetical protein
MRHEKASRFGALFFRSKLSPRPRWHRSTGTWPWTRPPTFLGSHQFAGLNGAASFFGAEFDEAGRAADVPEPGSLAPIAIALAGAAAARRRT